MVFIALNTFLIFDAPLKEPHLLVLGHISLKETCSDPQPQKYGDFGTRS